MSGEAPMLLSEVEARVAELAAAGTAVPAIAGALELSTTAVTEHMMRVYRKLGRAARP